MLRDHDYSKNILLNNSNEMVSVIINTYNRAHTLGNTLSALRYLDYPNFEVIVVNGPSTDATESVLERYKENIKVLHCPEINLSMSRNLGIMAAAGRYISFIDDDAIPEPEWLSQAIAAFTDNKIAGVGGRVYNNTGYYFQYNYSTCNRLGNGNWQLLSPFPQGCFRNSFEFPYLQGTNCIFRREAVLEVGGFDVAFAYYHDETDLCVRLIDCGYVIKQLENAYVHHKFAPSHIRSASMAKTHLPVIRSQIYFSFKHGSSHKSSSDIAKSNAQFIKNHKNHVKSLIRAGHLEVSALRKFNKEAREALVQALALLKRNVSGDLKITKKSYEPFKKYLTLQDPECLCLALLCEDYPPDLLGGIARFTKDKATALAQLGVKVHVICRGSRDNTVDFEDGVWVHRLAPEKFGKPDAKPHSWIPDSHWVQACAFLRELDQISAKRKIDIVENPIWNFPGIAALFSGRYTVITSLQTTLALSLPSRPDLTCSVETMDKFVNPIVQAEHYMITRSHAILAISQSIAEEVEKTYNIKIDNSRLFVSYLGIPDWANCSNLKNHNKPLRVLFVGRLEKRKGIDILLESIPELCKRHHRIHFDIVGDDTIISNQGLTYKVAFEAVASPSVLEMVTFHGKISDTEVQRLYRECDVFVAPSRFESFGLIYLEAMSCSKPVVGCNVGGIPEVVEHEKEGLLVPPNCAQHLFTAIDRLLLNAELRYGLGLAGRKKFELMFTDKVMAKNCYKIYLDIRKTYALLKGRQNKT